MEKTINLSAKKKRFKITLTSNKIILQTGSYSFFAEYPMLNKETGFLTDVDEDLFLLMFWILLYNLDEVELPEERQIIKDGKTLVSFSGGADSTALVYMTGGVPVHITRSYQPLYENRQIRACDNIGALRIITDFEKIREMYIGRHGFSIGVGYSAMFLPILGLLGCSSIAMGVVFDDLAFHYGDVFKFNNTFHNTGFYKIKSITEKYGIDIIVPLAGYSEILSIELAAKSGIKGYSSCHSVGSDDACRDCYKCFRKEAIRNKPLDWNDINVRNRVMPFLQKKPLKMAASTVYAIQKAGYKDPIFDRYMDIDVSWCKRINKPITEQFSKDIIHPYDWQTDEDIKNIHKFVDRMNEDKMYIF